VLVLPRKAIVGIERIIMYAIGRISYDLVDFARGDVDDTVTLVQPQTLAPRIHHSSNLGKAIRIPRYYQSKAPTLKESHSASTADPDVRSALVD
jgi:hypothetical protein